MPIFILICVCYASLIIALLYGWKQIPEFTWENSPATINFSIIIPFRNEAEHLPFLLNSLAKINYPEARYEIILVDDESQDNSVEIIQEFLKKHSALNMVILKNKRTSNAPKKDAISTAISLAKYEYILTTDADCTVPETWLKTYNNFIIRTGNKLIAAPVALAQCPPGNKENKQKKMLYNFEALDVLSLQLSSAGAFGIHKAFMCNGANLCYQKEAFLKVLGFCGNDHLASGDDVFLLQKFQEKKNYSIGFLKSQQAIVHTQPQKDLVGLISQRVRWASKTPAYSSYFAKFTGLSVLFMNLGLAIATPLVFFQLLPYRPILIIFFFKFTLDLILIFKSAVFFQQVAPLQSYFWSSILYPFFITYVALKSLLGNFYWKGRKF